MNKAAQASKKPRIVLVGDCERAGFSLRQQLETAGYQVFCIGNTIEALDQLESPMPVDLLIIDACTHRTGTPNGFTLGRLAHMRRHNLPILYLDEALPAAERELAFGPTLHLPINAEQLAATVR